MVDDCNEMATDRGEWKNILCCANASQRDKEDAGIQWECYTDYYNFTFHREQVPSKQRVVDLIYEGAVVKEVFEVLYGDFLHQFQVTDYYNRIEELIFSDEPKRKH